MSRFALTTATLVVLAGACSSDDVPLADGDPPLIAVHAAYAEAKDRTATTSFDGERLHLPRRPVFADQDIVRATAELRDSSVVVSVELTTDAAERLRAATAENVGERMAVLFDGTITDVLVIASAIEGPTLQLRIPAPSEERQQEVAERVRDRWPE